MKALAVLRQELPNDRKWKFWLAKYDIFFSFIPSIVLMVDTFSPKADKIVMTIVFLGFGQY